MGGWGSGWQGSSAPTVESKRKLDLADLDRLELRNRGDQKGLGPTLVELKKDLPHRRRACSAFGLMPLCTLSI